MLFRSDVHDSGQGLHDALAAYQLLTAGNVPNVLPQTNTPGPLVRRNIELNTNLPVLSGFVARTFVGMKPGQRSEILYDVPPGAGSVKVTIRNVQMRGPQNPYYGGDTLFLYVHSAKTSAIGNGDYLEPGSIVAPGPDPNIFVYSRPDTGILRITLNPDTLNAGLVDAEVSVETVMEGWPDAIAQDTIQDGSAKKFEVNIPSGIAQAQFLLTWEHDWSHFPVADLDMFVCSPAIPNTVSDCMAQGLRSGVSIAGPERAVVANPAAGRWTVVVNGFNVPTGSDAFKLRVGLAR